MMKTIIYLFCFLLSCFMAQGQTQVIGEQLDMLPKRTEAEQAVYLEEQTRLRDLAFDIRNEEIVLDLNIKMGVVDTIVEEGEYRLAIKHPPGILLFEMWRDEELVEEIEWQEPKQNMLYNRIQSRLLKPVLQFGPGTVYEIQLQQGRGESQIYFV